MTPHPAARIAILSTYPPTQCGLATFTSALREHLGLRGADVVSVIDGSSFDAAAAAEVVAVLHNGVASSAAAAVTVLNSYDLVLVQHEYGIYGGPDGRDVLAIVERLTVPVVTVLHTVLTSPSLRQRRILMHLVATSQRVVTMTETARSRLIELYGVDSDRIVVIPHGAVSLSAALPVVRKPAARPLVLTWGLLGPGKGIEWAIDAMLDLRDLNPRYLVLGKTHPKVAQRDGESYRNHLMDQVRAEGLEDIVEFNNSYLTVPELGAIVSSADVVLLPYDSLDQVTSGVLIEAVAANRPVVSTSFPHARELLGDGAGSVVARQDPAAIAASLRAILTQPGVASSMVASSERTSAELLWPAVGARYRDLVNELLPVRLSMPA